MSVEGETVEVEKIYDVIESNIDGTFNGQNGKSVYKLINGQVWKQKNYKYVYKYAYRPEVIITNIGGIYIINVEGTTADVWRIK